MTVYEAGWAAGQADHAAGEYRPRDHAVASDWLTRQRQMQGYADGWEAAAYESHGALTCAYATAQGVATCGG